MSSSNASGTPATALDRQELERRLNTARQIFSRAVSLLDGVSIPPMRYSEETELVKKVRLAVDRNVTLTRAVRLLLEKYDAADLLRAIATDLEPEMAELKKLVT